MDAYWKYVIGSYLIKGKFIHEIASLTQLNYQQVQKLIRRYWSPDSLTTYVDGTQADESFKNARKELVAPILAFCFSKNMPNTEIARKIPFFKNHPSNVNFWTSTWFPGLTPTQARNLLTSGMDIETFLHRWLQ
jgi:hypothetical protein